MKRLLIGDVSRYVELFNGFNGLMKIYSEKRERYFQYLAVQVRTTCRDGRRVRQPPKRLHIESAERPAATRLIPSSQSVRSSGVVKQDQVEANIIKCTTQPDQLPF
jgi:hypothetical protein